MAQYKQKNKRGSVKGDTSLPFTKTNYLIFLAGLLFIIFGYIALGQGPWNSFTSLSLAPVLLIIGYLVLIPAAILYKKRIKVVVTTENPE